MAPRVPEEIDVFTAPHSRMKELVNIYTHKMQCVDFRDGSEVISLLQDLTNTLYEFKSHESIENIFIMDQLKNRLKQRKIFNTAVCDCHNDNRLGNVVQLVRTGKQVRERSVGERVSFGLKLQQAFEDFVRNFLPHMEEEEQVFQPLLVEYFDYDELKILKEAVLKEHELVKERQSYEKAHKEEPEISDIVKDLRDLDWDLCSLEESFNAKEYCETSEAAITEHEPCTHGYDGHIHAYTLPDLRCGNSPDVFTFDTNYLEKSDSCSVPTPEDVQVSSLPVEVLVEIFQYLTPPELGRCAQVCSAWNVAAFSPSLWKALYPVQWARGIWKAEDVGLSQALEDAALSKKGREGLGKWDEDADVDEAEEERDPLADQEHFVLESLVQWVLPRVGVGVYTLVVDAGHGVTSRLLHQALLLCPNLTTLSAAHTQIDYCSFKGLWLKGCLQKLRVLDLQGCEMIDDLALEYLAQCSSQYPEADTLHCHSNDFSQYVEMPEDVHYNEDAYSEEEWPLKGDREPYQYYGYCRCWCAHVDTSPLAGVETDLFWKTGYCVDNPCHSVSQHINTSVLEEGEEEYHIQNNSVSNRCSLPSETTAVSNFSALHVERDIEEICCCPRNGASWGIMPAPLSCRNQTYQSSRSTHSLKPISNNYSQVQLARLSLSGCWRVTDEGLMSLVYAGVLNNLSSVDVSGCYQLTGEGLEIFTSACPILQPENLWYCDNIDDGPYPTQANGCSNLCNPVRACCRSGR
ncbi:F-box/LRR-repeat protein 5 isoform X2 [Procambarus clarkii]|nr:F-box/LRR-repeat protein 5-like isoform X2 [Procambarus clarkii]